MVTIQAPAPEAVKREVKVGEQTYTVMVKPHLSINEMGAFAAEAANNCFQNGSYTPYTKQVSIKAAVIAYYTDVEIPQSIDELYALCNCTNIVDVIHNTDGFDWEQYHELMRNINELVEWRKQQLLHAPSASDRAIEAVAEAAGQFGELIADLRAVLGKYDKKLGRAIKPKQLASLIERLSSATLTEKGMLDAVVAHVSETAEKAK